MTRVEAVARRYTKALLGLAPTGDRERVGREIEQFLGVLEANPVLREPLTRPWIKRNDKRAILESIVERAGALPLVRNFLGLLAEKNRVAILPEIVNIYWALLDLEAGRVRAEVRAALPLNPGERTRLAEQLGRAVGRIVLLNEVADPQLLAGFRVQIGSLVLDASLQGQLESMRERLTAKP